MLRVWHEYFCQSVSSNSSLQEKRAHPTEQTVQTTGTLLHRRSYKAWNGVERPHWMRVYWNYFGGRDFIEMDYWIIMNSFTCEGLKDMLSMDSILHENR